MPFRAEVSTVESGLNAAKAALSRNNIPECVDIYEALVSRFPAYAVPLLAQLHTLYESLPDKESRYALYVSRHFAFTFSPQDKVLDIGSGNIPFPFATHLADLALKDDLVGRAGAPFKTIHGRKVYECSVESMPFEDKEFDFIHCSHVLEHVDDPEKACLELMRVGKRGYIETPTRGKDLWLDTGKASNHRWAVDLIQGVLTFTEYTPEEIEGLQCSLLLDMHTQPQTEREKAFSALLYLKAPFINTMLAWDTRFEFQVRRLNRKPVVTVSETAKPPERVEPVSSGSAEFSEQSAQRPYSCLFVNTYYDGFLQEFYGSKPQVATMPYALQRELLHRERFGDSDFYSKGLRAAGWIAEDVIINCNPLQQMWCRENGFSGDTFSILLEQVKRLKPDVVYIQDMHMTPREVIRALKAQGALVAGQVASAISDALPLDAYDLVVTSFAHFADRFRRKKVAAYYHPLAFDSRVLDDIGDTPYASRIIPCSFIGGISPAHTQGFELLTTLTKNTPIEFWGYGVEALPQDSPIRLRHHGAVWGKGMFKVFGQSRITINRHSEAAENNANNMRLFEATGCGSLLITDYKDNLNDLFEVGREVAAYRSSGECAELIRYYLDHPAEAEVIARAGQARTLKEHSYLDRMRYTAKILKRHVRYRRESGRYPAPDMARISYGHTSLEKERVTPELTSAWKSSAIPPLQRGLVQQELARLYQGDPLPAFSVLANMVKERLLPDQALLEIGCASGYYSEILEYLCKRPLNYHGIDYSRPLLDMARDFYPEASFYQADGARLPFLNNAFSMAVSSCILLHTPNYLEHLTETIRVANDYVVLHRTPVSRQHPLRTQSKFAYGIKTVELTFNEADLLKECSLLGLKLLQVCEISSEPGQDQFTVTYLFKKIGAAQAAQNQRAK